MKQYFFKNRENKKSMSIIPLIYVAVITIVIIIVVAASNTGWNWGKFTILANQRNILLVLGLIALIIIIILGYIFNWNWIGVSGYTPPSKEYQREKTLWDWMQLLLIPLLLAGGGWWFSAQQAQRSQDASTQQHLGEFQIAKDQQQEAALQSYLDHMSDLLLGNNTGKNDPQLRNSQLGDEVRKVARVRTLTVLHTLDGRRKGVLLGFLAEAQLICVPVNSPDSSNLIIELYNADLRDAELSDAFLSETDLGGTNMGRANLRKAHLYKGDLRYANLLGANLSSADLRYANLLGANLHGANLQEADLQEANLHNRYPVFGLPGTDPTADLTSADLSNANLQGAQVTQEQLNKAKSLKGATMPDGSKHP